MPVQPEHLGQLEAAARAAGGEAVKPLTTGYVSPKNLYDACHYGNKARVYIADEADAVIRELERELEQAHGAVLYYMTIKSGLEAERDAARAIARALQFRVEQQRILAGFGDTDLRLAREQRDEAYKVLRRIAGYTMSQFASAHDLAAACVQEARELFTDEDETNG